MKGKTPAIACELSTEFVRVVLNNAPNAVACEEADSGGRLGGVARARDLVDGR